MGGFWICTSLGSHLGGLLVGKCRRTVTVLVAFILGTTGSNCFVSNWAPRIAGPARLCKLSCPQAQVWATKTNPHGGSHHGRLIHQRAPKHKKKTPEKAGDRPFQKSVLGAICSLLREAPKHPNSQQTRNRDTDEIADSGNCRLLVLSGVLRFRMYFGSCQKKCIEKAGRHAHGKGGRKACLMNAADAERYQRSCKWPSKTKSWGTGRDNVSQFRAETPGNRASGNPVKFSQRCSLLNRTSHTW